MNEQDEKILQLYLKDIRKKRIIFIFIIIFLILFLSLLGYSKYRKISNEVDNTIQEEIEDNIINENNVNETITNTVENTLIEETKEKDVEKSQDAKEEIKTEQTKEDTKKQETPKENTQTTTSKENKTTSQKPSNKDFLFTEGYTMDNVTQAAQDYLKSYSYGGECVPIKDNEGVYLGMRVIFY